MSPVEAAGNMPDEKFADCEGEVEPVEMISDCEDEVMPDKSFSDAEGAAKLDANCDGVSEFAPLDCNTGKASVGGGYYKVNHGKQAYPAVVII